VLKDLDLSPATWTCYHCLERVPFAHDAVAVFRHLALECPLLPAAAAEQMVARYQDVLRDNAVDRALLAHVMKHPEDATATFRPPTGAQLGSA